MSLSNYTAVHGIHGCRASKTDSGDFIAITCLTSLQAASYTHNWERLSSYGYNSCDQVSKPTLIKSVDTWKISRRTLTKAILSQSWFALSGWFHSSRSHTLFVTWREFPLVNKNSGLLLEACSRARRPCDVSKMAVIRLLVLRSAIAAANTKA